MTPTLIAACALIHFEGAAYLSSLKPRETWVNTCAIDSVRELDHKTYKCQIEMRGEARVFTTMECLFVVSKIKEMQIEGELNNE